MAAPYFKMLGHMLTSLFGLSVASVLNYLSVPYTVPTALHSRNSGLQNAYHGVDAAMDGFQAGGSGDSGGHTTSSSGKASSTASARHLLYQRGSFRPEWRKIYGSSKSRWHPTVLASVFKAQQMLSSTPQERAGRLFVPMLSNRHHELCCMLTDLNSKVGATNGLDVFIFTVDNKAQQVYTRSSCWRRKFNITVVFMPLDEHWGVETACSSSAYHDHHGWTGMPGLFGESCRRMGHWRLTCPFAFSKGSADMLGYRYEWQLDDDSFFKSPVNMSMIDYMQKHELWVAGMNTLQDPHWVTWGLPEIARLPRATGHLVHQPHTAAWA